MDAAEKKRKMIIGTALAVTLIAVVLVDDDEDAVIDTAQPVSVKKTARSSATGGQTRSGQGQHEQNKQSDYLAVDQLGQRTFNPHAGALFASMTWTPKRPQQTPQQQEAIAKQRAEAAAKAREQAEARANAPPPAPTPPPLEFKYIGKAIDGHRTWVFLTDDEENYIARVGEKIDDQYRLDHINEESVTLTYLPLNAKQTLPINEQQTGKF